MRISKDLREFIALLNSNAVEYLVVGAFAVAWHGYPRYTGDLDILVRSGEQNAGRLLVALEQFGFGSLGLDTATFAVEGAVVQLGVQPNRIDLLTSISGVSFEEAWEAREHGTLDSIEVAFIGRAALIRNKKSTGRAKDLGDVEELGKIPDR
jgi:hypothetical protein